jgi:hypothetical protein
MHAGIIPKTWINFKVMIALIASKSAVQAQYLLVYCGFNRGKLRIKPYL